MLPVQLTTAALILSVMMQDRTLILGSFVAWVGAFCI
jgi:hypothetical protein